MKFSSVLLTGGALVATAALTSGCGGMYSTAINYAPTGAVPAAGSPAVTVSVADKRPAGEGGSDPRRVGTIRALAGNGAGMREESPDAVPKMIEKATADGLAGAGMAASPGQPNELAVSIGKFWMDGYSSYTAEIEATLTLRRGGKDLWTRVVKAKATGEQSLGSASAMFNKVWGWALERYSAEVARAVGEPEFAAAYGRSVPAAPAAAPPAATPAAGGLGLSVQSEFGIDERFATSFTVRARDAMREAGFPNPGGRAPLISIRYVTVLDKQPGGYQTAAKITTRLSFKSATDAILWEDSFVVKRTFATPDNDKNGSLLDAEIGSILDLAWVPELVKRLKSPGLAAAREGKKP
jgi:hypothetical protein